MSNKAKSGKSLILLIIVICVTIAILTLVARIFDNKAKDKKEEEAFKINVYEYYLEIEQYKNKIIEQGNEYNDKQLNVCGIDLKAVIPNIIETDIAKFKIEEGRLVYIGIDQKEKQWTQEVRI